MRAARHLAGMLLIVCVVAGLSVTAFGQAQGMVTTIATGGADPVDIAVNPVTNVIYIPNYNSANVTAINGLNNESTLIPVDSNPVAIGINAATNKIYVADFGADLVTVIKASQNNQTISISTGHGPYAIAVDEVTDTIYVANYYANTVTVINGSTDAVIATVAVQTTPRAIAVNQVTNKVYVANWSSNSVSVIDPTNNNHTLNIAVGTNPVAIAINQQTNQIYIANYNSQFATAIDGSSNNTSRITTGNNPRAIAVNQVTNHIFVANYGSNNVTVIDGSVNQPITNVPLTPEQQPIAIAADAVTGLVYVANNNYYTSTVSVIDDNASDGQAYLTVIQNISTGREPVAIAVNPVTDRIYTANSYDNTFSVIYYSNSNAVQFVPVAPCRLIDTRSNGGPLQGGQFHSFNVPALGGCNIPSTAAAFSLNVTVVPQGDLGYLTIWPTGEDQPVVSTLNSPDGRVKANAAIVPAGYQGNVNVYVSNTTNVILDIDGYFAAPGAQTYQFYPLTPCRVVDTRSGNGGPLQAGIERDYTIAGSCGIPSSAVAYSFNVTVLPTNGALDYLTVWPQGQSQPTVSTLNDSTGTVVANAAIVPAGANNTTAFYAHNKPTNLLLDVNGYFAPAGIGGLSLYPMQPCRVLDTRGVGGPFVGLWNAPGGVDVLTSPCVTPATVGAFVFNATVVPSGRMPYLTLWPHNENQPTVSTLNAYDGFNTSNMAIVPTNDGSVDAYADGLTNLIIDISSYFAP